MHQESYTAAFRVLMALLVAQLPVSLTVLLPNAGSYLTVCVISVLSNVKALMVALKALYFAAGIVMQFLVGYEWMREQVLGMVVLMIAVRGPHPNFSEQN